MGPLPETRQLLAELIAEPSVSCVNEQFDMGNLGVIERLAGWLEDLGFRVRVQALAGHRKANLIATLGDGENGLLLAGHADTVPFDESEWATDPFELTERDGRLHGLGTTDMKSFLGLATAAAAAFRGDRLKHPLTILATADEETTMSGARALDRDLLAASRYAVIGEPTAMRPIRMHKGIVMEALKLTGKAGHSSNPINGSNAIEAMQVALGAILDFRRKLQQRYRNPAFDYPAPSLNPGHICGGDNPNRICAACELQYDLRVLPSMHMPTIQDQLHAHVESALENADLDVRIHWRSLFDAVDAFETAGDAELVRVTAALTGQQAGAVAFATEAPFLHDLGLETVVLGPGDIEVAHQANEYLRTERVDASLELLRKLIQHFCLSH